MKALADMPISFPGLFGDWSWNPDHVALHIGHGIYWYGVILAFAMLCGMYLSMKQAKRFGLTEDHISDLVLIAVPCCIVGSRAYYVFFNQDLYRAADGSLDWRSVVAVWDGGIAMYGTVIVGFLVAFLYTRVKKIPMGALTDTAVLGLLLGQAIGRWANLINREAFGTPTDLPWRMRLWVSSTQSIEVHPTFLYESLWNFLGLALMLFVVTRGRRFDGENTWFYFLWYGTGRFWIEGLRSDSLYLFGWTFFGHPIRVSQLLSAVMAVTAAVVLYYELKVRHRTADGLYVNRIAADGPAGDAGPEPTEAPSGDTEPKEELSGGAEPTEEPSDGAESAEVPSDDTEPEEEPSDGAEPEEAPSDDTEPAEDAETAKENA